MAFKIPIVCKEIYLPVPDVQISLAEYKEKTGIDLGDFITIFQSRIQLDFGFSKLYMVPMFEGVFTNNLLATYVSNIEMVSEHQSSIQPAVTRILATSSYSSESPIIFGLELSISESDDLSKENIKVGYFEV